MDERELRAWIMRMQDGTIIRPQFLWRSQVARKRAGV